MYFVLKVAAATLYQPGTRFVSSLNYLNDDVYVVQFIFQVLINSNLSAAIEVINSLSSL